MKKTIKILIFALAIFCCGSTFAQTYTHTTINYQNKTGFDDKCIELLNAGYSKSYGTQIAATNNGFAYVASFVFTNTDVAVITPSQAALAFGTVTVGNTSTLALHVDGRYITSGVTAVSSNTAIFTISPSSVTASGTHSVSGDFVVTYAPNDSGVVSTDYITLTDGGGLVSSIVALSGTAAGSLNTHVTPSVSLISFASTVAPVTYTLPITAEYVRTGSIQVTSSDAAFTLNTASLAATSYSAGGVVNSQVIITFTPVPATTSTGYITLYAVGIVPVRIYITGIGG